MWCGLGCFRRLVVRWLCSLVVCFGAVLMGWVLSLNGFGFVGCGVWIWLLGFGVVWIGVSVV